MGKINSHIPSFIQIMCSLFFHLKRQGFIPWKLIHMNKDQKRSVRIWIEWERENQTSFHNALQSVYKITRNSTLIDLVPQLDNFLIISITTWVAFSLFWVSYPSYWLLVSPFLELNTYKNMNHTKKLVKDKNKIDR